MLTEKDYCDYDTCVALKELGYNQSSIAFYPCQDITVDCVDSNGDLYEAEYDKESLVLYSSLNLKNNKINKVQAQTLYEAQKWLREKHKLHITIYSQSQESWQYRITKPHQRLEDSLHGEDFSSFEEALSEGVKCAVKILKEK